MKALTLKQPWACAVAYHGKDVENRTWRPPTSVIGPRIAIHAGMSFDKEALDEADEYLPDTRTRIRGCVVAVATVIGWISSNGDWQTRTMAGIAGAALLPLAVKYGRCSTWFTGPYGWLLTDVIALPEPIPCKGAQGLWTVPPDVEAEIDRQVKFADILDSVDAGKRVEEVSR